MFEQSLAAVLTHHVIHHDNILAVIRHGIPHI